MRSGFPWLLALLVLGAPSVPAQNYPSKPVRFIVPYAPGGSSDILARLLGQQLTETFGQTIVVDNCPGAGSVIGTAILAKSAYRYCSDAVPVSSRQSH